MINKKSIEAVDGGKFSSQFRRPHPLYNFANIVGTVEKILTSKTNRLSLPDDVLGDYGRAKFDNVILFFIDAFGWKFIREHIDHPFLKTIERQGVLSKLTSQFPSTTAAQITSIHTGLSVGESGVYEWFFYEPTLDRVIAPLLFSFAEDNRWGTLVEAGVNPEDILPTTGFYTRLKSQGIGSFVFQSREYTPSAYSNIAFRGAKVFPYKTLSEALVNLGEILIKKTKYKRYFFLYYDAIDSIGHKYGPGSKQFNVEINVFLDIMENVFLNYLRNSQKTLFLIVADHGQVAVSPKKTIYLDRNYPRLLELIKKNKKGQYIAPCGSARDMFLPIKPESIDKALKILSQGLKGKAEVYKTDDLIAQGFFGKKISPIFLSRVGNVVILPDRDNLVWWWGGGTFEQKHFGHHGGLTPAEMEIGLGVLSG